jgi:hypothetical protein
VLSSSLPESNVVLGRVGPALLSLPLLMILGAIHEVLAVVGVALCVAASAAGFFLPLPSQSTDASGMPIARRPLWCFVHPCGGERGVASLRGLGGSRRR